MDFTLKTMDYIRFVHGIPTPSNSLDGSRAQTGMTEEYMAEYCPGGHDGGPRAYMYDNTD